MAQPGKYSVRNRETSVRHPPGIYRASLLLTAFLSQMVDDLRNKIRQAVGRYERVESTAFTKEALAAVCDAVDCDIETTSRLPPKSKMRAGILWKVGVLDEANPARAERPFRKAELETIAATLRTE